MRSVILSVCRIGITRIGVTMMSNWIGLDCSIMLRVRVRVNSE